ncbi:hypothetical protein GI584_22990 [Gracilibacillus salitolerans]|uniref:Uncharacterized protein n=1 Tax=Gracilibacillus salitolerans TaxID=2663022 RepID=A0A5Q2TP30_9BACI|nr:hypothetical protein [Gracilibacillus salitolerans]QGH36744.1 hypothetical protein GI584_22990 [Gracilibacillus salitolerans]
MQTDNMNIGDKILFILGMSLCGVLFFVLVAGVIVALFISWDEDDEERTETSGSAPIQNKKIVRKQ